MTSTGGHLAVQSCLQVGERARVSTTSSVTNDGIRIAFVVRMEGGKGKNHKKACFWPSACYDLSRRKTAGRA